MPGAEINGSEQCHAEMEKENQHELRWGQNNNLGRAAVRVMQPGWSLASPHPDAAQPLNHDQGCQKWKHRAVSRTGQGRARNTGETGQIGRPSQIGVNVRVHFVTGSRGRWWWKHLKQQFNSAGLAKNRGPPAGICLRPAAAGRLLCPPRAVSCTARLRRIGDSHTRTSDSPRAASLLGRWTSEVNSLKSEWMVGRLVG